MARKYFIDLAAALVAPAGTVKQLDLSGAPKRSHVPDEVFTLQRARPRERRAAGADGADLHIIRVLYDRRAVGAAAGAAVDRPSYTRRRRRARKLRPAERRALTKILVIATQRAPKQLKSCSSFAPDTTSR
jgi:hypothetical protein